MQLSRGVFISFGRSIDLPAQCNFGGWEKAETGDKRVRTHNWKKGRVARLPGIYMKMELVNGKRAETFRADQYSRQCF